MAKIYARKIVAGEKSFAEVPDQLKEQVKEILLTTYGIEVEE